MAVTSITQPLARPVGSTELFERWRKKHDRRARDVLIERFLPLARKLARRYAASDEPYDDLVQVASLGLVKAVERFDPDRGFAFTSFAVPTIVGELKRYFRDTAWALHVDRSAQERARRIAQARREMGMAARAGADGRRAGRVPRDAAARRSWTGSRSARRTTRCRSTPPAQRRRRRGQPHGGDRQRGRAAGEGRRTGDRSSPPLSVCPSASATSCSCASVRT